MKKADPQHGQTQQQPAAKQAKAASGESLQGAHTAQLEAMMNNSPRQIAQKKKFDSLFGVTQRVTEEEPLQGKFEAARTSLARPSGFVTQLAKHTWDGSKWISDNGPSSSNAPQPKLLGDFVGQVFDDTKDSYTQQENVIVQVPKEDGAKKKLRDKCEQELNESEYDEIELALEIIMAFADLNKEIDILSEADNVCSYIMFGNYDHGQEGITEAIANAIRPPRVPEEYHPEFAQEWNKKKQKEEQTRQEDFKNREAQNEELLLLHKEKRSSSAQEKLIGGAKLLIDESPLWCPSGFDEDKKPRQEQKEHGANAFAKWIVCNATFDKDYKEEPAKEPVKGDFMNCWEAVFFAAYKAGLVTKEELVEIYLVAQKSSNPLTSLLNSLNFDIAVKMTEKRQPQPGDILFVDGAEHVMIYLGDGNVIHLWHDGGTTKTRLDGNTGNYRNQDIESLTVGSYGTREVKFAPSPF